MTRIPSLVAVCVSSTVLFAQQSVVIPAGLTATEGTSSTAYPWGRGASQCRVMYVYDSAHFLNQSVNFPVLVTQLRWRANGGATNTGGTYTQVDVAVSTAAVDYTAVTTTFANNHGNDLLQVYSGPVAVQPGAGTTPNNFYVDVTLAVPFFYDPTRGDFVVDIATDAQGWVGSAGAALDSAGAAGATSRVYNLTNWQSPTGTTQVGSSPILEVGFVAAQGAATAVTFGAGCPAASPLALAASARPIVGTTVQLTTSAIPANTPIGAQLFGLTRLAPPLDLTPLGMAGCFQQLTIDASVLLAVSGTTVSIPFAVPNDAALSGVAIQGQSATFSAGFTSLGVITSNGLTLNLGTL